MGVAGAFAQTTKGAADAFVANCLPPIALRVSEAPKPSETRHLPKKSEMKIRIEATIEPQALKQFLEERDLPVPVFFEEPAHNLVITVNPRNRAAAISLIEWLMPR